MICIPGTNFLGITQSNDVGVEYEYSNLGYALLGTIISNVSKGPYQQYIRDNILLPLGMANTTFEYTDVHPDSFAPGFRFEVWTLCFSLYALYNTYISVVSLCCGCV